MEQENIIIILYMQKTYLLLNELKKNHTILGSLKYGKWQVYKDYKYGFSMISALSNSNSLVILNKGKEEVQKEELLKLIPFDIDFCEENLVFN
ncbi:hypothetical protein JCM11957_09400 [Caminibacter profundus]